jgi:hypothetical protein
MPLKALRVKLPNTPRPIAIVTLKSTKSLADPQHCKGE